MSEQRATRRQFLKQTSFSVASASVLVQEGRGKSLQQYLKELSPGPEPREVIAALGDTLIPTQEPDYPGYRRLEKHGITEEVLKGLKGISSKDFLTLNGVSKDFFGKTFVELDEEKRASYVEFVMGLFPSGSFGVSDFGALTHAESHGRDASDLVESSELVDQPQEMDKKVAMVLQTVFKLCRTRVLTVFYRNFPYHTIERDEEGAPILTDREHQIINPNKSDLITGWDVAGFRGPLSWEEEVERRDRFMKIHWHAEQSKDNIY